VARCFGAGDESGARQIGQFWMKRLWRQKLGGKTTQSRHERAPPPSGMRRVPRAHATPTPRLDRRARPDPAFSSLALALATLSAAVAPAADAAWTAPQTIVADAAASNVRAAGNRRGSEASSGR